MIPWLASWAHCLSIGSRPGIPRATTISHPSRSISSLAATARSLNPGTVRETTSKVSPNPGQVASSARAVVPMS